MELQHNDLTDYLLLQLIYLSNLCFYVFKVLFLVLCNIKPHCDLRSSKAINTAAPVVVRQ